MRRWWVCVAAVRIAVRVRNGHSCETYAIAGRSFWGAYSPEHNPRVARRQLVTVSLTDDAARQAADIPRRIAANLDCSNEEISAAKRLAATQHVRFCTTGIAHNHTLLRYDARGAGLSQREIADKDISLERWVKDLECVVDAAGLDKFALLGISQGSAISIAYAAQHPQRVTRLILYGGYPTGLLHRGVPEARHLYEVRRTMVAAGWGSTQDAYRKWFALSFIPGGTVEQSQWFSHLEQISTSPAVAERFVEALANVDVRSELPKVNAPTLVLHCREDHVAPLSLGQDLAAGIKQAKFVPSADKNHLFLPNEPAHRAFFAAVNEFLGDPPMKGTLPGTERPDHIDAAVERIRKTGASS
jgi:pimeloyl-ACP methyl ester carboxylesterase